MIEHDWEPKIWWKIPKNWRILDSKDSRFLDVWGDRSKQGVLSLLSGLHGTAESSVLFRFLVMGVHYSIIIVRDAPNCWIIGAFQICLSFYFQIFMTSVHYSYHQDCIKLLNHRCFSDDQKHFPRFSLCPFTSSIMLRNAQWADVGVWKSLEWGQISTNVSKNPLKILP